MIYINIKGENNMKKIVLFVALVLILTGCAGGKDKTVVCSSESLGMKTETKIDAKDDKVYKITQTSSMDIKKAGYDKEKAEDLGKQIALQYKDFKGLTYSYEVKEDIFSEKLIYDLDKADLKELQDAGFINVSDEEDVKYIGLEKSKKQYEDNGYTCK